MAIVLAAGLLGGGAAFWWLPRRAKDRRSANERRAHAGLRLIASAEADLRVKDLDGNGVFDFWTIDVVGLHHAGLIDRDLAEADALPRTPVVPAPVPFHGYYFKALRHPANYGFVAYPAEPGVTGSTMYLIDANNVYAAPASANPVPGVWPDPDALQRNWFPPY